MASEKVVIEWRCGMCGHWSPRRCRTRCQRCGAVRGYGYQDREAVEERVRTRGVPKIQMEIRNTVIDDDGSESDE